MENQVFTYRESDGGIVKIEIMDAPTGTTELAKEYAKANYPDRYVVFSDKRTINDDGDIEEGLYMSLLLRPSLFPSQAALLGAMSATAMATGLEEHTLSRIGIGWVADIYCEGIKIGGITIEGKLDNHTTYEYIVVTFSARLDKKYFPPRLNDMIRQVFEKDNISIALIMAKTILGKFFKLYTNLKTSSKFMEEYNSRFVQRGVIAKYFDGTRKRNCRICGIDKNTGALLIELSRKEEPLAITSPTSIQLPKRVPIKSTKKV